MRYSNRNLTNTSQTPSQGVNFLELTLYTWWVQVLRFPNLFKIRRPWNFASHSKQFGQLPVLAAICLTVKRRSSITTCSTRAIMSSDRLVRGRGSCFLFSHDVRPSLNCRTHERTFFTSITPSLHVSLNCR